MRSVGVFRAGAGTQTAVPTSLASLTRVVSRDVSRPAFQKAFTMDSSQLMHLRATQSPAVLQRTHFDGTQTTVLNSALRRVRNAGAAAPKKKGARR